MTNNLISIIITTKNESKNLPILLKSIHSQSCNNFEVILVDNGSTDETISIAQSFGAKVFGIGPERSAQRNFGVKKSSGRFVLILDADMALTNNVLNDCIKVVRHNKLIGALIIPERSFGVGFWAKCKIFEREFYVGDESIEAPRFFKKSIFEEFGGYDQKITGPEDFDLPLRMRKSGIKIGRIESFINHNEGVFSLIKSAKKKFYYAAHSRVFLKRHPEQVLTMGNLVFRPIFFKKWKKMITHPILASGMILVKTIEGIGAFAGVVYSGIIWHDKKF